MDAVGAPDADGLLVAEGEDAEGRAQPLEPGQEKLGGRHQLQGLGGVHHVGGGQSEVDMAGIGADGLLEVGEERDHVVARARLDLVDARGVDLGARLDPPEGVGGDDPALRVDLADGQLDLEPGLVLRLLGPDPGHLWTGVARDHPRRPSREEDFACPRGRG